MLQRIQSVFMGLSAVVLVVATMIPFGSKLTDQGNYELKLFSVVKDGEKVDSHIVLGGVLIITTLLVIVNIFMFKNRKLQKKLNNGAMMLCMTLVLIGFLFVDKLPGEVDANYGFSIFLPIISGILLFLANKNIAKDEALVKAADRLR